MGEFSNGTKAEAMVSSASSRGDLAIESASTALTQTKPSKKLAEIGNIGRRTKNRSTNGFFQE
jgi:hypothetical protein